MNAEGEYQCTRCFHVGTVAEFEKKCPRCKSLHKPINLDDFQHPERLHEPGEGKWAKKKPKPCT